MNVEPLASNIVLPGLRPRRPADPVEYADRHRISLLNRAPHPLKDHVVAWMGEFVGTFLFLFFAFAGTQVANTPTPGAIPTTGPNPANILYIALSFGFSLAVSVWVFFRVTGGMFNPCVSMGLALVGAVGWTRTATVITAQIISSIAASAVVSGLLPGDMKVTTTLAHGVSVTRGLFIEFFLTILLLFTILMLAAEKSRGTFLAPVGIGLALFVAHLAGAFYTGAGLNPARSFGPHVIVGGWPKYHWLYWVGPMIGTLAAVFFYKLIKALEYETVNPGQDSDGLPLRDSEHEMAEPVVLRFDGAADPANIPAAHVRGSASVRPFALT